MPDIKSDDFERVFRDLLVTEGSSDRVALELLNRLRRDPTTPQQRKAYVQFLIQAGYNHQTLQLFEDWFRNTSDKPIAGALPLREFCELLHSSGYRPKAEFLIHMLAAVDEVEEPQFYFTDWETLDPRFKTLKEKAFTAVMVKAAAHKEALLTKLDYYRQNRMLDEETRLIDELIETYPHDSHLKNLKENLKLRWADALIARKALESFDESFDLNHPLLSETDKEAARIIASSFLEAASQDAKASYDLALGLYFLELYDSAKTTLEFAPEALNKDWFMVECLLQSRRFVECLDYLILLEAKYSADPETTFGATYYRAQALNGLGQLGVATELLKSIVAIRPSYRAAHSLLLKWAGRGLS